MAGVRTTLCIVLIGLLGCEPVDPAPSDDPSDWEVDTSVEYSPVISEPRWVVPSPELPASIEPLPSNNNVDIVFHGNRLFMAWRSSPNHFASAQTVMFVVSSTDGGASWDFEDRIALDADVREPRFLSFEGRLQLLFFEGGTDPFAFEPRVLWRTIFEDVGAWSAPEVFIDAPEVPWDVKVRDGSAWMTSYEGEHYGTDEEAVVQVYFKQSLDGEQWEPVQGQDFVYEGGVSEVAFEFDEDGGLWAVTRNEDGDASGWGSHVCTAEASALGSWDCPSQSDPERYDSPELFRHGDDLYLVARRDVGGPFGDDEGLLLPYSNRPKRTALYRIDRDERAVVHLVDLSGAGETAFTSVRRTGAHSFLLANYTSPLDDPDITWIAA